MHFENLKLSIVGCQSEKQSKLYSLKYQTQGVLGDDNTEHDRIIYLFVGFQ